MKNLIITGVVGLVFFGASYAASTVLLQKKPEEEVVDENATAEAEVSDDVKPAEFKHDKGGANKGKGMPSPFKPPTLTEDSMLRMMESIQQREASLKQRKSELLERETRQQMILADINRQKREYEAIAEKVQTRIAEANKLLQLVNQRKAEIEKERNKIEVLQKDIENKTGPAAVSLKKNVKKIADYLAGMPSENAAKTLKAYADGGNLKFAASILSKIEERTAAKILTALEDPILVTQLLDEIKNAKDYKTSTNQ